MTDQMRAETELTDKEYESRTAEKLRQGRIVLHNRRRKLIFFGGLAVLVLIVLMLRFAG